MQVHAKVIKLKVFAVMASRQTTITMLKCRCIHLKAGNGGAWKCACNDQSSCTLRNAQSLQVCTLSSSKFCLTIDFTFIDGLCIVQVSKIDTTEEAPVRLSVCIQTCPFQLSFYKLWVSATEFWCCVPLLTWLNFFTTSKCTRCAALADKINDRSQRFRDGTSCYDFAKLESGRRPD